MKQLLSIIIALYYLAGSIGLDVNVHYCAGQIESVSLVSANSCCCLTQGLMKSCCGDETISFELADEDVIVNSVQEFKPFVVMITPQVHYSENLGDVKLEKLEPYQKRLNLPPPEPLWLLYQSPSLYA